MNEWYSVFLYFVFDTLINGGFFVCFIIYSVVHAYPTQILHQLNFPTNFQGQCPSKHVTVIISIGYHKNENICMDT